MIRSSRRIEHVCYFRLILDHICFHLSVIYCNFHAIVVQCIPALSLENRRKYLQANVSSITIVPYRSKPTSRSTAAHHTKHPCTVYTTYNLTHRGEVLLEKTWHFILKKHRLVSLKSLLSDLYKVRRMYQVLKQVNLHVRMQNSIYLDNQILFWEVCAITIHTTFYSIFIEINDSNRWHSTDLCYMLPVSYQVGVCL